MKKALSVFLAILMLFAALSVGATAADATDEESSVVVSPWHGPEGSGKPARYDQAVIVFHLNSGKLMTGAYVYDTETGRFEYKEAGAIEGDYVMVPMSASEMKAGYEVTLPLIEAPSGQSVRGWYCYDDNQTYAQGTGFTLPSNCGGKIIEMRAYYAPGTAEEDTLTKVMGILMKVFGAIIGLLMYGGDTEAGVALMEKVLGGLFN